MNFWYCETCGKRLTEKDLEEGSARNKKLNGVFCKDCSVGVMTMEMDAISIEQAAKAKAPAPPSRTSNSGSVPRKGSGIIRPQEIPQRHSVRSSTPTLKSQNGPLLLAGAAALLVACIVVFVGVRNRGASREQLSQTSPKAPALPASVPVPAAAPPKTLSDSPVPAEVKIPETPAATEAAPPTPAIEKKPDPVSSPPGIPDDKKVTAAAPKVEAPSPQTPEKAKEVKNEPAEQPPAVHVNKSREQFAALSKELAPLLKLNHFTAAKELLEARRRDPAFNDAVELMDKEKADLAELLVLRNRAMEALRAKSGTTVSLKKGMSGTVKAEPNKEAVSLVLKEGVELAVTIDQLDADDINALLPAETGAGKAADLRQRAFLFMAAGQSAKAEDYFVKARDAGAGSAVAPYLDAMADSRKTEREALATELWKKTEAMFAAKNWQGAKANYELLQRDFATSAVFDAETVKKRLEDIQEALDPGGIVSVDLGGGMKLEMAPIPAGEFEMGSKDGAENEKPVHKVKITHPFYMGKFTITQAQYEKIMGNNPSYNKAGDNYPVETVSYDDVETFLKKLNSLTGKSFRLPTEAEWEYACRAGTKTRYNTGDGETALQQAAWHTGNTKSSHPVGQKKPNAWGLYDMHGNVFQMCQDYLINDFYSRSPVEDPLAPINDTLSRVMRGGSWFHTGTCYSSYRGGVSGSEW
jgi:formylglycine-generating enzyme required for sulfatase activity